MQMVKPILEFVALLELAIILNWLLFRYICKAIKKQNIIFIHFFSVCFLVTVIFVTFGTRSHYELKFEFDAFRITEYIIRLLWYVVSSIINSKQLSVLEITFYLRRINEGLLNILLFIPVGYLKPILAGDTEWKIIKSVRMGFIASFLIEIFQLILSKGTFDLGDLLHNTMGAGIGGLVYISAFKKMMLNQKVE